MAVLIAPPTELVHPLDYREEISARVDVVRVLVIPERRYLMIDGRGAPGADGYADAIGSLYPVAYTLHFTLKKRGIEEPIGALEGLYDTRQDDDLRWRLMLPVPHTAAAEDVIAAIEEVRARGVAPRLADVRCEAWQEGLVAQLMHIGPYEAEAATSQRLLAAIEERGLRPRGLHHEIYISDPNRTKPDRLKTLLRQPVEWA